jgi:hypothetical protein
VRITAGHDFGEERRDVSRGVMVEPATCGVRAAERSDVAAPVEDTKESTASGEFSAGCQITK